MSKQREPSTFTKAALAVVMAEAAVVAVLALAGLALWWVLP